MKILKVLIITLLLIQCDLYSQKIISNKSDTLIGYTLVQNDFIIKGLKQWKYYKIADSICEKQNQNNVEIIKKQQLIIKNDSIDKSDFKKIIKNNNEFLLIKDNKITQLTEALSTAKQDIKFQKVYKWTAIIVGGIVTTYVTYKYITK